MSASTHLKPRTMRTSAGLNFQECAEDAPDPQMSTISPTVSRLSTVLICVNRENLSLTLHVVTLERKDTSERTSRSNKRPPRRLKLKTEYVIERYPALQEVKHASHDHLSCQEDSCNC